MTALDLALPWILGALVLVGALFVLIAAAGLVRLPDPLLRMHASTKAGVLGVGLVMIAVALGSGDGAIALRAVAVAVFLWATTPIACHLLGRASYFSPDVRLSPRTEIDELAGHYDTNTHACLSGAVPPANGRAGEGPTT